MAARALRIKSQQGGKTRELAGNLVPRVLLRAGFSPNGNACSMPSSTEVILVPRATRVNLKRTSDPLVSWPRDQETMGSGDENAMEVEKDHFHDSQNIAVRPGCKFWELLDKTKAKPP